MLWEEAGCHRLSILFSISRRVHVGSKRSSSCSRISLASPCSSPFGNPAITGTLVWHLQGLAFSSPKFHVLALFSVQIILVCVHVIPYDWMSRPRIYHLPHQRTSCLGTIFIPCLWCVQYSYLLSDRRIPTCMQG